MCTCHPLIVPQKHDTLKIVCRLHVPFLLLHCVVNEVPQILRLICDYADGILLSHKQALIHPPTTCMSTLALISLAVAGVALLLVLVIVVRLQAFVALLLSSIFVAIVGGIPISEITTTIQNGMGSTLGYIAIVVGIGAMFGE